MRLAAAVALALLAGATAALGGVAGSGWTLVVAGSVESITAERSLVDVHVKPTHGCDYIQEWGVLGFLRKIDDCGPSDAVLQDLTLAGSVPIWWDWSSGNHVYCDDVYTTDSHFKARPLGICDGTEGDTYYSFAGDRNILAISDYSVCESDCTDANGNLLPDGDYGVEVRLLKGGKLVTVLPPRDFRRFLDARSWHIAVIEPKATLTVFDSRGTKLWSRAGVTDVRGGWIAGNSVVVQQRTTVRAYSPVGDGVARTLPRGAHAESAVGGLVLYVAGSSVRLLRLSDGRDRKLVTAKGLVGAQLTPAGVFYAAGSRVTFVPIRSALAILRWAFTRFGRCTASRPP